MTRRAIGVAAIAISGFVVMLVVGAAIVVFTGAYNVAATAPHSPLTDWLMSTAMGRSVAARADEIPPPPRADSAMVRHGFEEYRAMCASCHGAPGVERNEIGQGIHPRPPDLAEEAAEWSDRELFWITKHGIKLAGMPAFGATHSDEELWGIVAFVRQLQHMSADDYRQLAMAAEGHPHGATEASSEQVSAGAVATDHERMEHGRPTGAGTGAVAHPPSHAVAPAREPAAAPAQRGAAATPATGQPNVDTAATGKLTALVAELLRDSAVSARVRADSALRRRWESEEVRRRLEQRPP
jgi:mono/diheme cytochrome c family protein